jgi:hypothetical protein
MAMPNNNNNNKAPETGACVVRRVVSVCGVGVRRGVARGVRSQGVGMATSRGVAFSAPAFPARARAFPSHALPAHAMR